MKKLVVFLVIVLVIVFVNVFVNVSVCSAQGLKYSFDSKVIMANSISHPQTSSLLEVLQTLPELLHRSSSSMLDNYYMTIDSLPVGSSSDVILSTILLEDIDKISISSSSTSNYENNGQGGSINISLKHPKKGFSGNAYGGVAYPYDFVPGFSLYYSNDRWSVRSFFTGELSGQQNTNNTFYSVKNGQQVEGSFSEFNKDESSLNQLAKVYASYSDGKNNLNFTFYEKYDRSKSDQTTSSETPDDYGRYVSYTDDKAHNLELMFKTSYSRQFPWKGNFSVEGLYTYNPGLDVVLEGSPAYMETRSELDRYSVSGSASYSQKIGYATPESAGLNITVGVSNNYTYNNTIPHVTNGENKYYEYDKFKTYYFSSYFNAQAKLGKFDLLGQVEFQRYKYNLLEGMSIYDDNEYTLEYDNCNKNYVGELAAVWNLSKNHILRLLATRSLKRPTMKEIFPYYVYSDDLQKFKKGSYDINPMKINSLDLGYIFSHDSEKNHWQASFDARFIHTYYNLNYVLKYDDFIENTVFQIDNEGKDNILNLDAMVQWKHDWFSVQATGNYFYRHTIGTDSYYNYYNFALTPQIMTNNNWTIAMGVNHSTKTVYNSVTQPALTVLKLHLAKTWNHLTLFLAGNLSLNHRLKDRTDIDATSYDVKYYVPVTNTLYAGIRYNF